MRIPEEVVRAFLREGIKGQLSECLSGAARQIALVPNLLVINLDQRIAEQFQQLGMQMQTQMQNMQTALLERLDQHSERFTRPKSGKDCRFMGFDRQLKVAMCELCVKKIVWYCPVYVLMRKVNGKGEL